MNTFTTATDRFGITYDLDSVVVTDSEVRAVGRERGTDDGWMLLTWHPTKVTLA